MKDQDTVKSRLLAYLKAKRISQMEFTRSLGVSPTYIGAMRKGIPAPKMKLIAELYPDLNRDWLLYGEGEMLLEPASGAMPRRGSAYETLLIPGEACAGSLQMWSEGVMAADCRRISVPIPGVDLAIPIKGDSMEPRFHEGSTLLLKRINDKAFIPWGHTLVLDTENGVVVKNIYPGSEADGEEPHVVAKSFNVNYPPFKVPYSSIYGFYRVLGSVDIYSSL